VLIKSRLCRLAARVLASLRATPPQTEGVDPQITTAVIAAAAAIVAVLSAQVVGGITVKREERRIAWERERWQAEQSAAYSFKRPVLAISIRAQFGAS
jgi:hypothetical protein